MAERTFRLEILTPRERLFQGEVVSLLAPGALGYLGVLAHHAPLVTTLVTGKVAYRDAHGGTTTLHSTGSGLLEVHHNLVTLLAEEVG